MLLVDKFGNWYRGRPGWVYQLDGQIRIKKFGEPINVPFVIDVAYSGDFATVYSDKESAIGNSMGNIPQDAFAELIRKDIIGRYF